MKEKTMTPQLPPHSRQSPGETLRLAYKRRLVRMQMCSGRQYPPSGGDFPLSRIGEVSTGSRYCPTTGALSHVEHEFFDSQATKGRGEPPTKKQALMEKFPHEGGDGGGAPEPPNVRETEEPKPSPVSSCAVVVASKGDEAKAEDERFRSTNAESTGVLDRKTREISCNEEDAVLALSSLRQNAPKVWVCDVCNSLAFTDFKEACVHEALCRKAAAVRRADLAAAAAAAARDGASFTRFAPDGSFFSDAGLAEQARHAPPPPRDCRGTLTRRGMLPLPLSPHHLRGYPFQPDIDPIKANSRFCDRRGDVPRHRWHNAGAPLETVPFIPPPQSERSTGEKGCDDSSDGKQPESNSSDTNGRELEGGLPQLPAGPLTVPVPHEAAAPQARPGFKLRKEDPGDGKEDSADAGLAADRFKPFHLEKWMDRFEELRDFKDRNGHCLIPHKFPENPQLARWCKRQRRQYKLLKGDLTSTMTPERVKMLEEIGFIWDCQEATWKEKVQELRKYRQTHGNCEVPSNYAGNKQLAIWVKCQRRMYSLFLEGKPCSITPERISELENEGFVWSIRNPSKKEVAIKMQKRIQTEMQAH